LRFLALRAARVTVGGSSSRAKLSGVRLAKPDARKPVPAAVA
jgi:hypothetical protein